MTLIVSCITPTHVVQVSDRQLVWITGRRAGEIADDKTNKALVVCNRLCVGYTGLAEIGGQKTDEWLLDVAASVVPYNPERVWMAIALRATAEFRNIRRPRAHKVHSFLISGWARFGGPDAPFTPFIYAISNAMDNDGLPLAEAQDSFRGRGWSLENNPFLIKSVGQPVPRDVYLRLMRSVRNYAKRERGPEAYIRLMATAVRDTAGPSHRKVGRDLMAISLPKSALTRSAAMSVPLAMPIDFADTVALYLPESTNSLVRYAPNYTCNGLSIANASIWPGAD